MASILTAALLGAVGGAVGAGALYFIKKRFPQRPKWLNGLPILVAILAANIPRLIEPSMQTQVMSALDDLPNIQTIREHYPEEYAQLRSKVLALPETTTREQAMGTVSATMTSVMAKALPKADGANSVALMALTRDEAQVVGAEDPKACMAFLEGSATEKMKSIGAELEARDHAVTSRLLAQAAKSPAPAARPLAPAEFEALILAALKTLSTAERQIAVPLLESGRTPTTAPQYRAMCNLNLAIHDAVLAMPAAQGQFIARRIYAVAAPE